MSTGRERLQTREAACSPGSGDMPKNAVAMRDSEDVCMSPSFHPTRHPILGIPIDFISDETVMSTIEGWRRNGETGYICVVNPWSVAMSFWDERMRAALMESRASVPDGVGITLAAKILKYRHNGRLPGPDLMFSICDRAREYGYRHFFYGGREGVAVALADRLRNALPGLQVAGVYCPPFHELTDDETSTVLDRINATEPDILWVGLGAPKQEKWMAEHWRRTKVTALIGVGAAFDFHSGNVKRAPVWMRRLACEWLWRLIREPRRLWPKNLLNPLFIAAVLAQRVAMGYGEKEGVGESRGRQP